MVAHNKEAPDLSSLTFQDILDRAKELDSPELRKAYAIAIKEDGGNDTINKLYDKIKKGFNDHGR